MKRVAWIYHPDYLLHTPPFEHPESPERLVAITDHLGRAGLIDRMVPVTPEFRTTRTSSPSTTGST